MLDNRRPRLAAAGGFVPPVNQKAHEEELIFFVRASWLRVFVAYAEAVRSCTHAYCACPRHHVRDLSHSHWPSHACSRRRLHLALHRLQLRRRLVELREPHELRGQADELRRLAR